MSGFYDIRDPETSLEFSDLGNFSCFLLCEKGSVRILLNDRIYNLEKNTIGLIPPFSSLTFVLMSDDAQGWITKMNMEDISDAVLELPADMKMDIRKDSCRYISDVQRDRILSLKSLMEDRLASVRDEGYFMVNNVIRSLQKALSYEVAQAYVSGKEFNEVTDSRKNEIFKSFLASVKVKYAFERFVASYAKEQNLSPAYLSEVVKEISGQPAKFWIEHLIFTAAVRYLRNPNFPIREIAWFLHFPDQSSFGKYFKNISGHSPASFRKNFL